MYEDVSAKRCMRTNYIMAKYLAPEIKELDLEDEKASVYEALGVFTFNMVRSNPNMSNEELGNLVIKYYGG